MTSPGYPFYYQGFGTATSTTPQYVVPFSPEELPFLKSAMENGGLSYSAHVSNAEFGGVVGTAGAPDIAWRLFICASDPVDGDLSGCRSATSLDKPPWPWTVARRRWDNIGYDHPEDTPAEHRVLAQVASVLAGLPAAFDQTAWLRYPTSNTLISSPINNAEDSSQPRNRIVGQAWQPERLGDATLATSHALRGVTLYDLAQMPDESFSIWDWAAGNEVCPLDDIDGMFGPPAGDPDFDPGNAACHGYTQTLGILNATHFLPASRSVYEHYHSIALSRMAVCSALQEALAPVYATTLSFQVYDPMDPASQPEVRDCELEALTFEMFAQHFLQDAWSTGHMWYRFGHPTFADYSFSLADRYGKQWDTADPPEENIPGRRAAIATAVALFSGMVHGTVSTLHEYVRKSDAGKALLAQYPKLIDLVDDPLSGPTYLQPLPLSPLAILANVEWRSSDAAPAQGVGDRFLSAVLAEGNGGLIDQRQRMLLCTAKSLREVYAAGPQAHGPLGAYSGPQEPIDFVFARDCWGQLATNASMFAAVSPLPLVYDYGAQPLLSTTFEVANKLIVDKVRGGIRFPNTDDATTFLAHLEARMTLDADEVASDYARNRAVGGRDGMDSARGESLQLNADNILDITFLGAPPNQLLTADPPVAYLDAADSQLPESIAPEDYFVRHLFWRAHPEDVCASTTLVSDLRDRCVAAAIWPGGDPDACTDCAMVAEMHMPATCEGENDSKCAAIGQSHGGGLPPEFLTDHGLDNTPYEVACETPAFYRAFQYCTGTYPSASGPTDATTSIILSETESHPKVFCDILDAGHQFFDGDYRAGTYWGESLDGGTQIPSPFGPTVTAYQDHFHSTLLDEDTFCSSGRFLGASSTASPRDDLVAAAVYPAPLWARTDKSLAALQYGNAEDLRQGRCQEVQRTFVADQTCAVALPAFVGGDPAELGRLLARDGQPYDPTDGSFVLSSILTASNVPAPNDVLSRCSYREPRQFVPTCAPGGGSCSASGLCSNIGRPTVEVWHADVPF